ncbi:MmyB family transcriptional regulator [Mycolicibacterium boenickei]
MSLWGRNRPGLSSLDVFVEFRTRWAAHNVTTHRHGVKRFCHPEFGDLTLTYNVFEVAAAPGLSLVGYTAEPNSPSAQALSIMSS